VDVVANGVVLASGGLVEDGVFALGVVTVASALEGDSISVTVRAWDKTTGASYDTATVRGSETLTVGPLGGSLAPPVAMSAFASFQLLPAADPNAGTFSAKNLIGTEPRSILNVDGLPLSVALGRVEIRGFLKIKPCAERGPGTFQDHHSPPRIQRQNSQLFAQQLHQLDRERIPPLRAIER